MTLLSWSIEWSNEYIFIFQHKGIEIWARPITPIYQTYYSYAIAFLNRRTDGTPSDVSVTLKELGLQYPGGYRVEVKYNFSLRVDQNKHISNSNYIFLNSQDLYEDVNYGVLTPLTKIKVKVNPSGVVILRCDLQADDVYASNHYTQFAPLDQVFKVQRHNSFKWLFVNLF